MGEDHQDIYDPAFVADLFDRCSARYRWWSAVASFGLVWVWRRACVQRLGAMVLIARLKGAETPKAPRILDLMAGTGEVWPHLLARFPRAHVTAIDISRAMHDEAVARLHRARSHAITHIQTDALTEPLPAASADLVIATFGLKTLTQAGQSLLAAQINTALAPGGSFALIEASDPRGWALRPLYLWYLTKILPLVERALLRGAQDFSMIGTYTQRFGDCGHFAQQLRAQGLFLTERRHFFGCATSVSGFKPIAPLGAKP
ncbi:Ubiquinone/menaquinone biosynthesis methyltransferase UbiE [Candidatus Rhodobacter oscarellae]|uniref:Ubiquinone/menaquinone biosynthesis methyltransferase UbiE n=1 Tax=Candidatus Rhodobacter oscarellae TaxID=1675527 RepID=A0A0J9GYA9_9RHOB|nr:class I SAM-dependent methyltransferase [Candidatus Rhodobacter lobularis]KMW58463.1 Ubiquinone/menaquinone biosynthesis methyltransferase UbiE [Candidatus Rhodobacter lobularis]